MVLEKVPRPLLVVSLILFVRLSSVFLVRTWYVPDEYWQTLEVAHKQTFGYGALTWEWQKGIRSYLYPSIISLLYTILKYTGLDYPEAVVLLPRVFQAIISTIADYSFYKWTGGRKWALYLVIMSWFWFYTSSRTLVQSFETALVAIALSVFPFKGGKTGYYDQESSVWVWVAVVCVWVRATSAPLWLVLGAQQLAACSQGPARLLLRTYLPITLLAGGALVALDSYFYGRLVITPWEFFKFNVLHDIASYYGKHPWHWYLTQGLPAVLGINLVPVVWAVFNILRRPAENRTSVLLLTAAAVHVALHSLIPHKEFRFVLPLLPILLYLAQEVIVPWSRKAKKWQLYTMALALLVGNALPAAYFGSLHQAGALQVMPLLRDQLHSNRSSLAFLMPCHSTPLYSHLHVNVSARYLNCDPPFNKPGEASEADAFFNNPQRWWRNEYAYKSTPTLVVLFDTLKGRVETLLAGYEPLHELPHTQYPEGEVGAKVLVYRKIQSQAKPPADETV